MRTMGAGRAVSAWVTLVGAVALGCHGSDAPKAWSALATCLAGPAAASPVVERAQKLRAAELASVGSKATDAWPARCAGSADLLYAATGDVPLLHRTLKERLACRDDGHCTITADETFLAATSALWEAAQAAKLAAEPVAGIPAPALMPPPLVDAAGWKSFSATPVRVARPTLNPDGSAVLLLAAQEGRARPRYCKLPPGFAELHCFDAHSSVPELPSQSIGMSRDGRGLFAAGLTDAGLSAYNLETGARSDVRGKAPNLVSDGLAVESASEAPAGAKPAAAPDPKAGAAAGFAAVEVKSGKASKEAKLPISPAGAPVTVGNQVVYAAGDGPSASLEVKGFSNGHLGGGASIKGPFLGPIHTCRVESRTAVATFDGYSQQHSAKPTAGADKTQFAIAFKTGDSWSKAQQATLPFDRSLDSDLVCSKAGAGVAWVRRAAEAVEVGRVDCTADGCKPQTVKLPGVESKWWGGVAPLGDKVLLFWRSTLGETRFRVAPLEELPRAPDQLLFDSADFGGPVAGEPLQVSTEAAALFVFVQARPVALRIGADGRAAVLAP